MLSNSKSDLTDFKEKFKSRPQTELATYSQMISVQLYKKMEKETITQGR